MDRRKADWKEVECWINLASCSEQMVISETLRHPFLAQHISCATVSNALASVDDLSGSRSVTLSLSRPM